MTTTTLTASGTAADWVADHRAELRGLLLDHGAVLVAGAPVGGPAELAAVRDAYGAAPAPAHEQFAPRRDLGHGVYAAPEWAADREMCHHHEQSYALAVPGLLIVAPTAVPDSGGALLLGDTAAMLDHLPAGLRDRFAVYGWRLVRNFHPYFGLSWSAAFGVDTPAAVEEACAARDIGYAWERGGTLRTIQHRAAVVPHPVTGADCWFNDVAFFSQWSVPEEERGVLLKTFGPEGMPFNTLSGDGEPVTADEFQALLDAYERTNRRVALRHGDLLFVDNVRTAHGREPYAGPWDLAVALADPVTPVRR
jgi:hypothetical protein